MSFNSTQLKKALLVYLSVSTFHGYALSANNVEHPINNLYLNYDFIPKDINGTRQFLNVGKSSIINEANQLIKIDYSICDYDSNKKYVSCRSSSDQILAFNSLDFQLNRTIASNNEYHYQELYVTRISSETNVQYFITDPIDASQYEEYVHKFVYGTLYSAKKCSMFYSSDIYIYETQGSYICK